MSRATELRVTCGDPVQAHIRMFMIEFLSRGRLSDHHIEYNSIQRPLALIVQPYPPPHTHTYTHTLRRLSHVRCHGRQRRRRLRLLAAAP